MRLIDLDRFVTKRAACRGLDDPDVMFPDPDIQPAGVAAAMDVCDGCIVRRECYELALRRGEEYGIWGGEIFRPRAEDDDVGLGVA